MTDSSNSPLLTYFVLTEFGTFEPGQPGFITLTVAPAKTGVVRANQISFEVPFGGPGDIFTDKPIIKNTSSSEWIITSPFVVGSNTAIVTLTNQAQGETVTTTFSFDIAGNVNHFNEPSQIPFTESSDIPGTGRPNFTKKQGVLSVNASAANTPPVTINSFIAESTVGEKNVQVPITQFPKQTPFRLVWNAQQSIGYELYQGDKTTPLYSGPNTFFEVAGGIDQATTFTLKASGVTDNVVMNTLTITVSDPELATLTVSGDTSLGTSADNTLTVQAAMTTQAGVTMNDQLTSLGGASFTSASIGTLTNSQGITANASLDVTGATNLAATTINDSLIANEAVILNSTISVTGTSTLQEAQIEGDLTVKGRGGKTFLGEGSMSGDFLEVSNCFSLDYRYYEVILENLTPFSGASILRAQLFVNGSWDLRENYTSSFYSHDHKGANAGSNEPTGSFYLWNPKTPATSTLAGVYGSLTMYNPAGIDNHKSPLIFLPYTGLLYAPVLVEGLGCQVFLGGAYEAKKSTYDPIATGIRFFFAEQKGDKSVPNGKVKMGKVRVYGWN